MAVGNRTICVKGPADRDFPPGSGKIAHRIPSRIRDQSMSDGNQVAISGNAQIISMTISISIQ